LELSFLLLPVLPVQTVFFLAFSFALGHGENFLATSSLKNTMPLLVFSNRFLIELIKVKNVPNNLKVI